MRFAGDVRAADREYAEALGLGDRIELLGYVSRRRSLELQRDSEALLLLIPDSGGRGKGVLTGKIFEYLAAERPILAVVPPDGAAADLLRETGAGIVVAPTTSTPFAPRSSTSTAAGRRGSLDGTAALRRVARTALARQARRRARRRAQDRGVTAAALPVAAPTGRSPASVSCSSSRSLFVSTFEKVHWNFAGQIGINDITTILFLVAFVAANCSAGAFPRTSAIVLGFFAVFALVYLAGYWDIQTQQGARRSSGRG